jgi:hypothetical protein
VANGATQGPQKGSEEVVLVPSAQRCPKGNPQARTQAEAHGEGKRP